MCESYAWALAYSLPDDHPQKRERIRLAEEAAANEMLRQLDDYRRHREE